MMGNVVRLNPRRAGKSGANDVEADPLAAVEHLLRGCLSLTQILCPERKALNAALFEALLCCLREQAGDGRLARR